MTLQVTLILQFVRNHYLFEKTERIIDHTIVTSLFYIFFCTQDLTKKYNNVGLFIVCEYIFGIVGSNLGKI